MRYTVRKRVHAAPGGIIRELAKPNRPGTHPAGSARSSDAAYSPPAAASRFFATTAIVWSYSSAGLNSMTSVALKTDLAGVSGSDVIRLAGFRDDVTLWPVHDHPALDDVAPVMALTPIVRRPPVHGCEVAGLIE